MLNDPVLVRMLISLGTLELILALLAFLPDKKVQPETLKVILPDKKPETLKVILPDKKVKPQLQKKTKKKTKKSE